MSRRSVLVLWSGVLLSCVLATAGCGGVGCHGPETWVFASPEDADGRPARNLQVVRVWGPDTPPETVDRFQPHERVSFTPRASDERVEVWASGYLPRVVARDPDFKKLVLRPGYPVRLTVAESGRRDGGETLLRLFATWRGPGDHPEALSRHGFQAAGVLPGDPGYQAQPADARALTLRLRRGDEVRFRVPWPGRYVLTWAIGTQEIATRHAVSFRVQNLDEPVHVDLPLR